MAPRSDTWTRAHDLALVYVALAYGTDNQLNEGEVAAITEKLQTWRENFALEDVQEVVMEAFAVFMEGEAEREVPLSMRSLRESLSDDERKQALEDIVRIAEADGVLLNAERSFISTLAQIWGVKRLGNELLSSSSASQERVPDWTLLHDLSLIYLVVAHSTDNDLSSPEIEAIISKLGDWNEGMSEQDVRDVVRSALRFYAEGPDEEALQQSIVAVKQNLPVIQRLAVLDDLMFVAEADGAVNEHERSMIDALAQAWDLGIRLNGQVQSAE